MGSTSAATCSNLKNIRVIFFKFAWQNKMAACHNQLILTMVERENSGKRWILLIESTERIGLDPTKGFMYYPIQ